MSITLKNTSSKQINAVQVAVGPSVFLVEFLDADEPKRRKRKPGKLKCLKGKGEAKETELSE